MPSDPSPAFLSLTPFPHFCHLLPGRILSCHVLPSGDGICFLVFVIIIIIFFFASFFTPDF